MQLPLSQLFDESRVLQSAQLHSQAVESRAIEGDVRRMAATIPEQVGEGRGGGGRRKRKLEGGEGGGASHARDL